MAYHLSVVEILEEINKQDTPPSSNPHTPQMTITHKQVLADKQQQGKAVVFGHSLSDLINVQLEAGFLIARFYENEQANPRFVVDSFMPMFLATRSIKA